MARQILPIAGQIIGGMIGGPVGAAIGGAIGSAVGAYVDPIRHQGPKLGEARAQTAQEGVYRPLVFGTACVAGNVIHRSPRKVVRHRESVGKGSRDTVDTDRGYRTFAIRIAEAHTPEGYTLLRIWENETLVYDVRPESEIPEESAEYAEKFRFYAGTQDQLPDPDLEAYLGVGNVNAYRGSCYIVFGNFDLTDYGDMVPQYRFEVASNASASVGEVEATYTMPGSSDASYMSVSDSVVYFASGSSNVRPGEDYSVGHLDFDLNVESVHEVEWGGFETGLADLNIRAMSPGGLGISSDGAWGYCKLFAGGGELGWFQPTDDEGIGWWFGESNRDPEYGGLIWFGDVAGGGGSWYLGVRATGGSSGYYRNRILKFPLLAGEPQYSSVVVDGIATGDSPVFWMHRSRDGLIHTIDTLNKHKIFDANLGLISVSDVLVDTSDMFGFGIDGDVIVICNGGISPGLRFYRRSTGQLIKNIPTSLVAGAKHSTRLIFTGSGLFVQRSNRIIKVGYSSVDGGRVTLASIVQWCHRRVGQHSSQFDVSALTDEVDGVVFADGYSARDAITTLLPIYNADASEHDRGSGYRINYIKRGATVVRTLTIDDLVDEPEETVREDPLERPRVLHMAFESPVTGYTAAKASIQRLSPDVKLVNEVSTYVPVTFKDANEAWQRADVQMRVAWTEVHGERTFSISDDQLDIVPTDVLALSLRGQVQRLRVLKVEYADGVLKLETVADRQSNYTSNVTGIPLPAPEKPPPSLMGPAAFAILDIPAISDQHDRLGYYVAVCGTTEAYAGAVIQRQQNGEWADVVSLGRNQRAIMGVLENTVTAGSEHYTDTTNTVSVALYMDDELESLSDAQWLSEGGAFALETESGWEIMQYRDAYQDSEGVWHLTHLARGRLNTAPAEHLPGSRFVLLDGVRFIDATVGMIGQPLTLRAAAVGRSPETAVPETITYQGNSQREFQVAHLFAGLDGDDLSLQATPRDRFGTEDHPVRSINHDGFRWSATDGSSTVSLDTDHATATLDVSGLSTPITVTVAQINRFTGAGPTVSEQVE